MRNLLTYLNFVVSLALSSLGIGAPMKLHRDRDNDPIPTTLKKSQIDQEERDGVVQQVTQFVDLAFKSDEEEVYKAYGIPLFKGSIVARIHRTEGDNGVLTSGFTGENNVVLEKIYELTESDKKLVAEWKKRGEEDGFREWE